MGIFDNPTPSEETSPDLDGQEEVTETGEELEAEEEIASEESEEETSPDEGQEEKPVKEVDWQARYAELRRDHTRKSMELATLKKEAPEGYAPPDWEQINEEYLTDLNENAAKTNFNMTQAQIQQALAPFYEAQAAQEYAKTLRALGDEYPDIKEDEGFKAFGEKVIELSTSLGVNPNAPEIAELAAYKVFGSSKQKLYEKAKAKGKQEALEAIQNKQGLSGPVGKKPQEQPKTAADQIRESILNAGRRNGIFG